MSEGLIQKSPIKTLLLSTVLFLPMCFFVWFYASSLLVIPVKYLLQSLLMLWQSDLFNLVTQNQYLLTVETLIFPSETFAGQGGKLAVLDVSVNPMIYGYGLAVISGLVLSTPGLSKLTKLKQISVGYLLVVLIQTFGCFWEMIKHLLFSAGPDAYEAIINTGMKVDFVALMYQMSYLIFPAVLPVAYWIAMNSKFISEITGVKMNSNRTFDNKDLSEDK
jgi:hypothetical protein